MQNELSINWIIVVIMIIVIIMIIMTEYSYSKYSYSKQKNHNMTKDDRQIPLTLWSYDYDNILNDMNKKDDILKNTVTSITSQSIASIVDADNESNFNFSELKVNVDNNNNISNNNKNQSKYIEDFDRGYDPNYNDNVEVTDQFLDLMSDRTDAQLYNYPYDNSNNNNNNDQDVSPIDAQLDAQRADAQRLDYINEPDASFFAKDAISVNDVVTDAQKQQKLQYKQYCSEQCQ